MPEEQPPSSNKKSSKDSRKLSSKTMRQRNQPYQKDNLPFTDGNIPSMDTLSFATEVCKNQTCTCNQQKDSSPEKQKEEKFPLNFAHASKYQSQNKKIVQEPRLKIHHKEKDRRVVIRAARLKLAKQFKQTKQAFSSDVAPKSGGINKESVFGSHSDKCSNFASLSTTKSESRSNTKSEFRGGSFGCYRQETSQAPTSMQKQTSAAGSTLTDQRLDMTALETSLPSSSIKVTGDKSKSRGEKRRPPVSQSCPVHPGRCSLPCSCSQQALMDPVGDWTVDELACYFDEFVHIPKKMSLMAEMMYT